MEVNFCIEGLNDPSTKLELGGSVYFMRNLVDSNYKLVRANIEFGKLCLEFEPRDRRFTGIIADRHYVNLEPNPGVVGLRIKTTEKIDDDNVIVSMYIVESVHCAEGYDQFCARKWTLSTTAGFAEHVGMSYDEEGLLLTGFTSEVYRSVTPFERCFVFPEQ